MRRVVRGAGFVALGGFLAGCYSLQPALGAAPEVGSRVAFDVNDAGRVALGGAMAPEIAQIEGRLIEKDSTSYVVAVSAIQLLRGGEQIWAGERVRLNSEYLGRVYERRFSPVRSIAMGVIGIGGFAVFFVTRALIAGGTEDPGRDCPDVDDCEIVDRIERP